MMAYTAGNLCVRMMSDEQHECRKRPVGVMVARSDFVAVAAVVSVLCGAFLPAPPWFVDILWGCSLCLSVALVLISLTGKDPLELSGLGPLMIFGALMRIGLSAATAGLVFRGNVARTLIEAAGAPLAGRGAVGVLLALPAAVGMLSWLTFRSAAHITSIALNCLRDTIPETESALALDEQAGLIRPQRARLIKDRLFAQTGFYLNMGGMAKLLRCEAAVAAGAVLAIVVGRLMLFTARGTMSPASLQECAGAAAGAGVLTLFPMLVVSLSAARLTRRSCDCLVLPEEDGARRQGEIIEIVSHETGRHERVELLNPDFAEVSAAAAPSADADEKIPELEPQDAAGGQHPELHKPGTASDAAAYYENLAADVAGLEDGKTSVLFAARISDSLPVTVPVNVGIRLAQRGLRTLVVDAESARQAVAAVFDAEIDGAGNGPVPTCVENLYVWGLQAIARNGVPAAQAAIRQAAADFDRVILYAPDLMTHEHPRQIIDTVTSALIFSEPDDEADLRALLQRSGISRIEWRQGLKAGPPA